MKDTHKLFKEFNPNANVRVGVGNCLELTGNSKTNYPECQLIHHPSKQLQCWAARCLLDLLMEKESEIEYDQFCAPKIKNSDLHISISHSSNFVAIALSEYPVGIDIQIKQDKIINIANKFVKKDESRPVNQQTLINWLHWQWGAKESLFKVYKKGSIDFKSMLKIDQIIDADALNFDSKGRIELIDFKLECMLHFVKLDNYFLVCAY